MKRNHGICIYQLVLAAMLILNSTCKKDNRSIPALTTIPISNINATTATTGGTITNDGGETILTRGVCWSTNIAPTIIDSVLTNIYGTDTFTCKIVGLKKGTTYYARAFATNNSGTGYCNAITFTTLPSLATYIIKMPIMRTAFISNYMTPSYALGAGSYLINISPHTPTDFQVIDRTLMDFYLFNIPLNFTIDSAKLSLYWNGNNYDRYGNNACYLQRITSTWMVSSALWWNQPTTTEVNQLLIPKSESMNQDYIGLNVTALVRDTYENPLVSFGFMLRLVSEIDDNRQSFNMSVESKSPQIEVYYSAKE